MFSIKYKITLLFVGILASVLLLSSVASAFTPDPNLPNCFMASSRQHTFCDSSYYGPTATAPASAQLQNGHCYVENRGGPNGDLTGYTEYDCANVEDTNAASAGPSKTTCEATPSTPGCGQVFDGAPCSGKDYCDFVNNYINPALNFLAVGFGLIVTITIVVSGIQYITSGGDPQGVNAAKKRIFNAVGALLLFIFMWALLQWLVPGGLF